MRPREKTVTSINAGWGPNRDVEVAGKVVPDPGGGQVRLRLDFANEQPRWVTLAVGAGGGFRWDGLASAQTFALDAVAWFDGTRRFGSSRSNAVHVTPPSPVR